MFSHQINFNQHSLKLDATLVSKHPNGGNKFDPQVNLTFKKRTETTPQRKPNQSQISNAPSNLQTQSPQTKEIQQQAENKSISIKNTPSTFLTLSPQTKDMQQSIADNRTIPSFATPSTLELKQSYATPDRRAPQALPSSGVSQHNYINKRKSSLTPPITPPKSQGIGIIIQSGHQYQEMAKKLQNENKLLESRLRKLQQQTESEKDIKKKHMKIIELKEKFIQMIDEYETHLRLNQSLSEQNDELQRILGQQKEQKSERFLHSGSGQQFAKKE